MTLVVVPDEDPRPAAILGTVSHTLPLNLLVTPPDSCLDAVGLFGHVEHIEAYPVPVRSFGYSIAYGSGEDFELAMLLGVDDYMREPWSSSELLFRLRRFDKRLSFETWKGRVSVHLDRVVSSQGRPATLRAQEAAVLAMLVKADGQTVTRKHIAERLGLGVGRESRAVDMWVSRVRGKLIDCLGSDAAAGLVRSVHGKGYRLCPSIL